MDYMDWAAAMDSEIFREYMRNEIPKLASEREEQTKRAEQLKANEEHLKVDAELRVHNDFDNFEEKLKSSPVLLNKFREVKKAFMDDPKLISQTDPSFVEGIFMLDLEDE